MSIVPWRCRGRDRMRRHLATTIIGLSLIGGCSRGGPVVTGDLALLLTGSVSGFLEPCG